MTIFLFAFIECFGTTKATAAGEGEQYPVFTDNASRIKYLSNGSGEALYWNNRSPIATNSNHFSAVATTGDTGSSSATTKVGICFGFCV